MKIDIPPPEKLACAQEGNKMRFIVPGRSDVVEVNIVDGKLELYPERSSAHAALIKALS